MCDLRKKPVADCRARLFQRDVFGGCVLIAMLDQEPRLPRMAATETARAHEHPRTLQLLAVESEFQIALRQRGVNVLCFRSPGSLVPHHHGSTAVFAFRDHTFEIRVIQWM